MCNLRTNYACGHVSFRKVSCRAKKARQQRFCFFPFVSALKCVDTNPQTSYEICSRCVHRVLDDTRLQRWAQQEVAAQRDIQLQPVQRRARPTSEELTIEAAMLPGHFNISSRATQRDSIISPEVQATVTMAPGVDYAPQVQQRHPSHVRSDPGKHATTKKRSRSGPSTPRGAPSSSRGRRTNTPALPRRTETSRWVDTTRYAGGDRRVSPSSSGWADPAQVSPTFSGIDAAEEHAVEGGLGFF